MINQSKSKANKPFYMIAHRVLETCGVDDAIKHGANAIEIDCTAWKKGWWADHDGLPTSAGAKIETMFKYIIETDKSNQISLVWLDIKNPDYAENGIASIKALREMAQDLIANNIRVLYGFYKIKKQSKAFQFIKSKLSNDLEIMALNGTVQEVLELGKNSKPAHFIMDYGYFALGSILYYNKIKKALEEGVKIRNQGKLAKVFGWTYSNATGEPIAREMINLNIDGLIYGFKHTHYYNHHDTRASADTLKKILNEKNIRLARRNDPWH